MKLVLIQILSIWSKMITRAMTKIAICFLFIECKKTVESYSLSTELLFFILMLHVFGINRKRGMWYSPEPFF